MSPKEAKKLLLRLQPDQIAGLSNEELCELSTAASMDLRKHFMQRRARDKAMNLCTVLFLLDAEIAKRLGGVEFVQAVREDDEEDEADDDHGGRQEMSLHELMSMQEEADDAEDLDDDVPALKRRIKELEARCTGLFRGVIRFTTAGCRTAEQVTKKWLAMIRRVDPEALRDLGMSQTDVARALGERRATTSAREKREFEAPMKRSGARGWRGCGGLRSEENRANCARAQKGNRNRAKGPKAQRDHSKHGVSGIPETLNNKAPQHHDN